MGYRTGDETEEFEGQLEHTTAKAYLVLPTMGPEQVWLPKSQVVEMEKLKGDMYRFVVTRWWAGKNGLD